MTDLPPQDGRQDPPAGRPDASDGATEEWEFEEALPPAEDDGIPELEPEFQQALRQAAGTPAAEGPEDASDPGQTAEWPADEIEEDGDEQAGVEGHPAQAERAEATDGQDAVAPDGDGASAAERQPENVRTVVIGAGRSEAREAVAAAAAAARPFAPKRPPVSGDPGEPPKRRRYWLRFLLGSFLVVASFASATTAAGLLRLTDIVHDIQPIRGIEERLAEVDGGEPQTFLILGSDKRVDSAGETERGLSDTTILLRVDPDQNVIAVLNIPRDLKVEIPGVGTDKFNAAYALGGPKLTLRTIQRLTAGMGVQINHLVNVDFLGFVRAINAIDCVYVDVDRRYYHSNAGLHPSQQYDEINVQPGYQKLCGRDALDYVRYRHTDTDLVRAARQQDFLRLARQRVPPSKLLTDQDELIDIFTSHTSSDIRDVQTMIQVLKLMIDARNAPIKEVHFPAVLGPSYVYTSRRELRGAIDKFLGFEASGGPRGALDVDRAEEDEAGAEGTAGGPRSAKRGRPEGEQALPTPTPESDGLVDAALGSRDVAARAAPELGPKFTIYYPRRLPSGTIFVQNPRVYHLNDPDAHSHAAYRMVMQIPQGDYFGVQGIRGWKDPPILDDPGETRTIRGIDYDIYLDGDRVRMIAWRDGGNSYWIANSLLQTLTNDQMLGIARSMGEIVPNPKPRKPKKK